MVPERIPLILSPTPLHRLDRLSEELGVDLWIKRDDLTGFALGGNKGRKLEYLMAAAVQMNADVVVTCGSIQSNFVRQLGGACSKLKMRCVAAVMDLPYEFEPPTAPRLSCTGGNAVLDRLLGVELNVFPDATWEELYAMAENLAADLEAQGKVVYRIPIGGSSPLGAFAFKKAAEELQEQAAPFDWILTASSSGSTQTGLTYALRDSETKVIGIASDPEPEIVEDFAELGTQLTELLGDPRSMTPDEFHLNIDFVGPGYGVPSAEGDAAIARLAQAEGIFLDPIYSGKAFAALLSLVESNQISGRVLFWHTGGVPTLFARE